MDSMDVDHEEIKANPGASKKLYPISKLTRGRKAGARTAKETGIDPGLRHRQLHSNPTASGSSGLNSKSSNSGWTVKSFNGTCAPYNDHANWVQDPCNRKVYMIGGIRPSDIESWEPTSDFFCYDTRSMKWEDLTEALVFREPYDPYSSVEMRRRKRPLPALSEPGCTLWRHENTSFVFMFGGYDPEIEKPSSRVVVINLEAREWWYEKVSGDPVPRITPAIVAIQNSVFVFGGYRSYEDDPLACYSYSVADWKATPSGSRWSWTFCDVPYSEPLPQNSCIGQAISVYGGKLILLTPGRTNSLDDRLLDFTDQNLFYFRPVERLFQRVPILGDPPRKIEWYSIFDLQSNFASGSMASSSTPALATAGRRPRGHPRKHPVTTVALQPAGIQVPSPQLSNSIPPSVVICAWLKPSATENEEFRSPEIYHFVFHPDDTCTSLNVMKKISNLKRDFQGCSYVNGHLRLLGNHQTEPFGLIADKTWNIYLDVPFNV